MIDAIFCSDIGCLLLGLYPARAGTGTVLGPSISAHRGALVPIVDNYSSNVYARHMICEFSLCQREFHPRQAPRHFCSRECWYRHKTEQRPKAHCARCGTVFTIKNMADVRRGKAKFCSRTCSARRVAINEHYFDDIHTEEQAYWLGLLITDGHNHSTTAGLTLSLHKDDVGLVEQFRTALGSGHKLSRAGEQRVLQVSSPPLARALEQAGCPRGKKSRIIRVPPLMGGLLRHFIRGAFDGDGWMTARKCVRSPPYWTWGIHSDSATFTLGIQQALLDVGVRGTTSPKKGQGLTLKVVGRDVFPTLHHFLYEGATVWMPRKRILIERAISQETTQNGLPRSCVV